MTQAPPCGWRALPGAPFSCQFRREFAARCFVNPTAASIIGRFQTAFSANDRFTGGCDVFVTKASTACALVAFAICGAVVALAQASGDGWQGPRVVSGAALDETLALAMNDFLQARYSNDDIMASLQDPAPLRDFAAVARGGRGYPGTRRRSGSIPASVRRSGDSRLARPAARRVQCRSRDRRGEELFVRVARAAGGTGLDFAEVAEVPPVPGGRARVRPGDLERRDARCAHAGPLRSPDRAGARNTMLSVAEGTADTAGSFDRYGESLTLY